MKATSNRNRNRGFTLLEVLVSMALILVALLGVFQLQGQSLRLQTESRFNTTALFLAQDRLSRILAQGTEEIGGRSGDFEPEMPGFRFEEEVSEQEGNLEGFYRVKVRVFEEGNSSDVGLVLETLIYR
ncbi:MAG: prepilin-type N-terminal cleavage/methylation domain-containing protein, partial [Deltaproteobacteria bacterium]|nr:prepilin-type N-terminal cleavage/methylation domain-containing protein [Deltaproteobacteria bacterium]MBW2347369.1 prepilin-type N-terminal cleavage/methylation domain-containing protein [Deltaproteobacteria bacterium]